MDTLFGVTAADVALTNDEWYTPRWLFDAAGITFDLDVCAPVAPEFRTCPARRYLTVLDDGLTAQWDGLVWMNPPYSNLRPWVERFAQYPEGLALIPAGTNHSRGILCLAADGIALISIGNGWSKRERLGFTRPDGSEAGYPIAMLVAARGQRCVDVLGRISARDFHTGGAWFVRGGEKV